MDNEWNWVAIGCVAGQFFLWWLYSRAKRELQQNTDELIRQIEIFTNLTHELRDSNMFLRDSLYEILKMHETEEEE